jgi:hypothetical protein
MEGGLVTKPGWQQDGIEAKLQLLIKDDRTVDLISKGAPPNDFKYSEHGCPAAVERKERIGTISDVPEAVRNVLF